MVYSYACIVFALVGVPVGIIFDKFGTMATRLIGATLFLIGNVLVLSAVENNRYFSIKNDAVLW